MIGMWGRVREKGKKEKAMNWKEDQEKKREEIKTRMESSYETIVKSLREAGAEVEQGKVNGENVTFVVRKQRETWGCCSGKIFVSIEKNYRSIKRFPEGKNGFNVPAIVKTILETCEAEKELRADNEQLKNLKQKTKEEAESLKSLVVVEEREMDYSALDYVIVGTNTVKIHLVPRTVNQAQKILETLKQAGLLINYGGCQTRIS